MTNWTSCLAKYNKETNKSVFQLIDHYGSGLIGVYEASFKSAILKKDSLIPRQLQSFFQQSAEKKEINSLYSNIVTSFEKDKSGRVVGSFAPIQFFEIGSASENILIHLSPTPVYKFSDIGQISFWLQNLEGQEKNIDLTVHFCYRKVAIC